MAEMAWSSLDKPSKIFEFSVRKKTEIKFIRHKNLLNSTNGF